VLGCAFGWSHENKADDVSHAEGAGAFCNASVSRTASISTSTVIGVFSVISNGLYSFSRNVQINICA